MQPTKRFAVLALALSLAPAHAQQNPNAGKAGTPGLEALCKRLDKNADGFIVTDELPPQRRAVVKRLDKEGDGRISLTEHLAAMGGKPALPGPQLLSNVVPEGVEAKRDIPYAGKENPRQKLDLYLPKKRNDDKPLPIVVFIHGGGWKAGDKASGLRNIAPYVSSGDYAGVSAGYRLTNEAQWPAQINDCKAAIRWVRANAKEYGLDAQHIAVWGSSAGGHLVSMLGTSGDVKELEGQLGTFTDQSSRVQAVINYYGPENFLTTVTQSSTVDRTMPDYPEALLIGGRVQDVPDAAKHASPVTYISKDDPPFLTAHGTKDPLVHFAQATELHETLKKAGVSSVLLTMQNGGHGFASKDLDNTVKRFLYRELRGIDSKIQDTTLEVVAGRKQ